MAILFSSTTGGETRKIKFCWNRSGVTVNLSIWMLNWINSQKEISNLRHTTNMHTTNNSRIGCLREFHRKKGKKSRDAVTFTHTSCHNIFGVYFFSIATVNCEQGNKYVFLCNYYVQYTEKSSNCKERRNTSIFCSFGNPAKHGAQECTLHWTLDTLIHFFSMFLLLLESFV